MNVKRKEAALRKIEQWKTDGKVATADDARQLLEQDDSNGIYPKEEIDEIIAAWELSIADTSEANDAPLPRVYPKFGPDASKPSSPNAAIADKLAAFDYSNLTGKNLTDYLEFHATLNWNTDYDYDYFRIDIKKEPRYEGVKDSPVDITGISLKESKPINTTRISAKTAATLNGVNLKKTRQGTLIEGAQFENTKKIYLLKK